MAGGPILPFSAVPVTAANLFPNIHVSAGANFKRLEGLGVVASLGADSVWALAFRMPPTLPTGTGKLRLLVQANATSGVARVNPKWASCAVGEDPAGLTLNAETVTPDSVSGAAGSGDTITWGTGDNDQIIEAKWTLNADTLVASELVVMHLTFETSSWTLAAISTWYPAIIWE